jgi:hypothetical protein
VAVPNDPVNLQRALWILRDLGLIEIRDSKPIDVTELDVIKNPGGIKIVPLEAAQAPRAIEDRARGYASDLEAAKRYQMLSRDLPIRSQPLLSHLISGKPSSAASRSYSDSRS